MVFPRDILSRFVGNIRTPTPGGFESTGTCIFIGTRHQLYLITAAHVVKNANLSTSIILSDNKNAPINIPLYNLLQGENFEFHPIADLAKAKIKPNSFNSNILQQRFFPFVQVDITDNLVSKDVELTTVGFPLGLGAKGAKFTPLTYRTYAAASTISLNRFDNQQINDFIILESPSIGGYSGGPVFDLGYNVGRNYSSYGEKTILHGIVHGTLNDATGGKLAAITPSKYLKGWL